MSTWNKHVFVFGVLFSFLFRLQKGQSTTTVTTIASIPSDNKLFINGKELISDQPVKVSKIEVIENKLSVNVNQSSDAKISVIEQKATEQMQQVQTPASTQAKTQDISTSPTKPAQKDSAKEKSDAKPENVDDPEESIVTADYIQQSKFSNWYRIYLVKKNIHLIL